MQNWFGLDPHPTDDMVHWSEKDPQKIAIPLREAYDSIVLAGLKESLELLLEAKREATQMDAADDAAGIDI